MSETHTITRKFSGRTLSVVVPTRLDPETGERLVGLEHAKAAELVIATELALHGPVDGKSFRFMRGAIGMKSAELAELLGVRPETVSRWERSVVNVDRAAWMTLGGLVLERVGAPVALRERLEWVKEGKRPPKTMELRLSA